MSDQGKSSHQAPLNGNRFIGETDRSALDAIWDLLDSRLNEEQRRLLRDALGDVGFDMDRYDELVRLHAGLQAMTDEHTVKAPSQELEALMAGLRRGGGED